MRANRSGHPSPGKPASHRPSIRRRQIISTVGGRLRANRPGPPFARKRPPTGLRIRRRRLFRLLEGACARTGRATLRPQAASNRSRIRRRRLFRLLEGACARTAGPPFARKRPPTGLRFGAADYFDCWRALAREPAGPPFACKQPPQTSSGTPRLPSDGFEGACARTGTRGHPSPASSLPQASLSIGRRLAFDCGRAAGRAKDPASALSPGLQQASIGRRRVDCWRDVRCARPARPRPSRCKHASNRPGSHRRLPDSTAGGCGARRSAAGFEASTSRGLPLRPLTATAHGGPTVAAPALRQVSAYSRRRSPATRPPSLRPAARLRPRTGAPGCRPCAPGNRQVAFRAGDAELASMACATQAVVDSMTRLGRKQPWSANLGAQRRAGSVRRTATARRVRATAIDGDRYRRKRRPSRHRGGARSKCSTVIVTRSTRRSARFGARWSQARAASRTAAPARPAA